MVIWPRLLHSLGDIAFVGAGVTQQDPHLRRTIGPAARDEDRQLCVGIVPVISPGPGPGILGPLEDFVFAVSICWGNKWGNMLHRFQPIST